MINQNNDRNNQIFELIQKNPGIKFREIMRTTGFKNGVVSHYLTKLEKNGTVQVHRGSRQTRFYPLNFSEQESKAIKALRIETPRKILHALMLNNDGLEFSQIVNEVSKSPSTVSLYLSKIVDDGLVVISRTDRKKIYKIKDKLLVDRLIEDYHPGLLDKPTSGLEDIINSL